MAGCGDVLSLEDLQTAKKHQIFEAEVITGKAGGLATGGEIATATNAVTGQVQKTLPQTLKEVGFKPASFTFVTGGTLNAGDYDLAVYNPAPNGDNNWYAWGGAMPKIVAPNSTPQTSGGFGASAWTQKTDTILRLELPRLTTATNYNVPESSTANLETGAVSGISFFYDVDSGITYFATSPVTGTITAISAQSSLGEVTLTTDSGSVKIIRTDYYKNRILGYVDGWGCFGGVTNVTNLLAALNDCIAAGIPTRLRGKTYDIGSTTIVFPPGGVLFGEDATDFESKSALLHNTNEAIVTDSGIVDFRGILIKNITISGGAAGKYAIRSHYPRTIIDGLCIDDGTALASAYKGNGIQFHNDGLQSGMGCWGSKIIRPVIIMTYLDDVHSRTAIDLSINGGDVEINNPTILHSNCAIRCRKCEGLNVINPSINLVKDNLSQGNTSVTSAAIILGTNRFYTNSHDFSVKTVKILGGYIEGVSRAVLVNDATAVDVDGVFFNDVGAFDPNSGATPINTDGVVYVSDSGGNVTIQSCYTMIHYSAQRLFYLGTRFGGMGALSVKDVTLIFDNYRQFAGTLYYAGSTEHSVSNLSVTTTNSDSSKTTARIGTLPDTNQRTQAVPYNVATKIFTLTAKQMITVTAYSTSENVDQVAVAKIFRNGNAGVVIPIKTATAISFSVVGDDVFLTQTNTFGQPKELKWHIVYDFI